MLHTFFMLILIYEYIDIVTLVSVAKLVMYKTCSWLCNQLRVRTAGVSFGKDFI